MEDSKKIIRDILKNKPDYYPKKEVEKYLTDNELISKSGLNYLEHFVQQQYWDQVKFDDFLEGEAILRDQRYDDDFVDNGHKYDYLIELHFGNQD